MAMTRAPGDRPFLKDAYGENTSEAAYYLSANRNKQSVTIDFTRPEGQQLVRELAAKSDILIENFKVGGLAAYGLDYESLQGDQSASDLLLDHRLWSDRALCQARRL